MKYVPWAVMAGLLVGCFARGVTANQPLVLPTISPRYNEPDPTLLQLLASSKRIEGLLARIAQQQAAQEPRPTSLKALVTARCASCHAEAVAVQKGEGFVLLQADGTVPPLSVAEKKRILREVTADRMPKAAPLSEGEKAALQEFLFPREQP